MNSYRTSSVSLGLLLLRLVLGATMIMHGWQKFNEWTVGGTASSFNEMGVPLPEVAAYYATYVELIGGILLIVGLLTRLVALLVALDMAGAILFVHGSAGFFASNGGYELVLVLGTAALALTFTGPGSFALDRIFVRRKNR